MNTDSTTAPTQQPSLVPPLWRWLWLLLLGIVCLGGVAAWWYTTLPDQAHTSTICLLMACIAVGLLLLPIWWKVRTDREMIIVELAGRAAATPKALLFVANLVQAIGFLLSLPTALAGFILSMGIGQGSAGELAPLLLPLATLIAAVLAVVGLLSLGHKLSRICTEAGRLAQAQP